MMADSRSDGILTVEQKYAPCLARISSYYAMLTEAERRVAHYILENPGYVLASSIAGVARESNVGLGTVNRFSNKLGYHSYNDLKIALAVELLSPQYEYVEPITTNDDAGTILQKVIKIGIQNLHDLSNLIDTNLFAEAAALLSTAPRIEVYATGGLSGSIAQMTQYRLLMLGIPCTAITDPQQQVISAGLLEKAHG